MLTSSLQLSKSHVAASKRGGSPSNAVKSTADTRSMKREIPTNAKYNMIESYNETVYVCNYHFQESCWLNSAFIQSNDSFWP